MGKNMAKTWLGRAVLAATMAGVVVMSAPVTASAEVLVFYYGDWKKTFAEADTDPRCGFGWQRREWPRHSRA